MDFPNYVPEGARSHALHFLGHYEPVLIECETRIGEITEEMAYWSNLLKHIAITRPGQDTRYGAIQLAELRQRKAEETKHHDNLTRDIASIKRLVHDDRMKGAYQILINAFFDDEDSERQRRFDGFIYAAWSARLDFSPYYRERLKRAAELQNEIARTADKLASLLERIGDTGVMCPSEFFSIPELLRSTDNHGHDFYIWQAMRGHVLGDPDRPRRELSENEQIKSMPIDKIEIVFVAMDEKPDIDPAEQARNTLRYGWEKSPPLSALLKTVGKAAKEFEPKETGLIGAAIDSRQKNIKAEYLRAFGNLLTDQHRFILTADIMKAMVIAANVVINSPDVDVTDGDARRALN